MERKYFWWDEVNTEHIAYHGVEPYEVEEALDNQPFIERRKGEKYLAYGQTDAGRYLIIIFALKSDQRLRVITARDMTQAEKRKTRYKRK